MLYLLDTSVCVSLIRGRANLTGLPPREVCVVSVLTAAELEVGICRSTCPHAQRRVVEDLLNSFKVVPFDVSAIRDYGEIRAELEQKGTPIGPLDLLIAAHARSLSASIVTGNVGEFTRVRNLTVIAWN